MQNRANLLYDMSAPTLGHSEPMDIQENVHEDDKIDHEYYQMEIGSPAITTLDFANNFAGTSSW